MTPHRFISIIRRRSLVVWCVLAVGLALLYSFRNTVPSSFTGVSHVVLVAENGARDPSVSIVDLPSIATSTVVLQRVREQLHLPISLIDLKANVSASVLGRSSIMAIGFRDQSAERAIGVSNAVSDELSRYYDEISTQRYDVNVDRLSAELAAEAAKMRAVDRADEPGRGQEPVRHLRQVDRQHHDAARRSRPRSAPMPRPSSRATRHSRPPPPRARRSPAPPGMRSWPATRPTKAFARSPPRTARSSPASEPATPEASPACRARSRRSTPKTRPPREPRRAPSRTRAPTAPRQLERQPSTPAKRRSLPGDTARVRQLDTLIAQQQANLQDEPTTGGTYTQLRAQRDAIANRIHRARDPPRKRARQPRRSLVARKRRRPRPRDQGRHATRRRPHAGGRRGPHLDPRLGLRRRVPGRHRSTRASAVRKRSKNSTASPSSHTLDRKHETSHHHRLHGPRIPLAA